LILSSEQSANCAVGSPAVKLQKTLRKRLTFSGVGVFTGQHVTMHVCPAQIDHGIVFKRIDLPSSPLIPAKLSYIQSSTRCSKLVNGEASVQTVEHLLAALRAYEIGNALIEISGPEVPILDGSSALFCESLSQEVVTLDANQPFYSLSRPVYWSSQDTHLVALPAEEYRVSYLLDYPHAPPIGAQYFTIKVDAENFNNEIASARTFCLHEEVMALINKGFIKGVSLDHGIVFNETGAMNPDGLRFSNEPVRHKILDLIGDLTLTGIYFVGHIIAIKSGHASHHHFGFEILNHVKKENSE
jgi:UDP-3-O-[3-hydroxymyristoyl] N-acetylglucosamine deacetylase